jgi:hypothetical protein
MTLTPDQVGRLLREGLHALDPEREDEADLYLLTARNTPHD